MLVLRLVIWLWKILECTSVWLKTSTAPYTPLLSSEFKVGGCALLVQLYYIILCPSSHVHLSPSSSSSPRLQTEPGPQVDSSSQRRSGDDRVPSSSCTEAQSVLESWHRAADQQQQVRHQLGRCGVRDHILLSSASAFGTISSPPKKCSHTRFMLCEC